MRDDKRSQTGRYGNGMEPETMFDKGLFPADLQPWDAVFDYLWVTHSEFWLVAGPDADIVSAIPDRNSVAGNGGAVGVPAPSSETHVGVALSIWEGPAPDGAGALLGTTKIEVPDREVTLANVEGREPGPVLVLPEADGYQVAVWRLPAEVEGEVPERFDIRMWPLPTP